ncbi:hypothetical protein AJ79_01252 [Helicocarpus griseus UAMH5409]|uniref:Uncharacterized protein n=1 Tax=Helicocarpus griseus UAMH5409 TaxID=1447875 RepID=A0A2B7XZ83_9EURO|nr:hypothetical protein AJ79_01252 [Helicocarpus griseus UAMH5409]
MPAKIDTKSLPPTSYCRLRGESDPVASAYDMETLKDLVNKVTWAITGMDDEEELDDSGNEEEHASAAVCSKEHDDGGVPAEGSVVPHGAPKARRRKGTRGREGMRQNTIPFTWDDSSGKADWHKFEIPGGRVRLWDQMLGYAYSSSRVSKVLESTARPKSGRGDHCKNVKFGVIRNQLGRAELALLFAVDAKNNTWNPLKQ